MKGLITLCNEPDKLLLGRTALDLESIGTREYYNQQALNRKTKELTKAIVNEFSKNESDDARGALLVELDECCNNVLAAVAKMIDENNIRLAQQLTALLNQK